MTPEQTKIEEQKKHKEFVTKLANVYSLKYNALTKSYENEKMQIKSTRHFEQRYSMNCAKITNLATNKHIHEYHFYTFEKIVGRINKLIA